MVKQETSQVNPLPCGMSEVAGRLGVVVQHWQDMSVFNPINALCGDRGEDHYYQDLSDAGSQEQRL